MCLFTLSNDLFHKNNLFQGMGCALHHGWSLYKRGRSMGALLPLSSCWWWCKSKPLEQQSFLCAQDFLNVLPILILVVEWFFSAFSGNYIFDVDAVVFISLLCCATGPCKFCLSLLPSISYCFVFIFKAQPFLATSNHRSPSVAGFLN